jgi:MHS family proline/betaine transporter-like MFS transporter
MATLLIAATANDLAPAWYLVGAAIISLIAVALSRETGNEPLRHE